MTGAARRVVTGLDEQGRSAVIVDGVSPFRLDLPDSGIGGYLLWQTRENPASNEGSADAADRPFPSRVAPPNGSAFYLFTYPPLSSATPERKHALLHGGQPVREGQRPGMHATASVDYIVLISGEMTLILESGEVTLRAGDTLVDRGILHAWENRGDVPAVFASITIDAHPLNGMTDSA